MNNKKGVSNIIISKSGGSLLCDCLFENFKGKHVCHIQLVQFLQKCYILIHPLKSYFTYIGYWTLNIYILYYNFRQFLS